MFSLSPNAYELQEQNHQERMQQAENYRLAQLVKNSQQSPSFIRKRIASIGKLLVTIGQSLQTRSADATSVNTISLSSDCQ